MKKWIVYEVLAPRKSSRIVDQWYAIEDDGTQDGRTVAIFYRKSECEEYVRFKNILDD